MQRRPASDLYRCTLENACEVWLDAPGCSTQSAATSSACPSPTTEDLCLAYCDRVNECEPGRADTCPEYCTGEDFPSQSTACDQAQQIFFRCTLNAECSFLADAECEAGSSAARAACPAP